jgi:hypothetical protein
LVLALPPQPLERPGREEVRGLPLFSFSLFLAASCAAPPSSSSRRVCSNPSGLQLLRFGLIPESRSQTDAVELAREKERKKRRERKERQGKERKREEAELCMPD